MKKFLMFSIACLFVSVSAFAQTKTVTGKIIGSDDGLGLPASVQVQGTTKGVSADIDGNYSIAVDRGQTLVISAIGYTAQEIVVGDANVIDVTLQVEAAQLTEAVVTALGIRKEKKALGYSVQDIKSEELLKNKNTNVINSLAGKIAGVNITQSSGAAGAGASITIRGGNSTSELRENQPLFVVDGVIYDNSTNVVGNSGTDGMTRSNTSYSNRVMDINPEDIENMSVLKGAAAAALYGSRAADGVIIITTKKGVEGVVRVDFSSKLSTAWANKLPDVQTKFGRGFYSNNGVFSDVTYWSWNNQPIADGTKLYDNIGNFFEGVTIFDNSVSVSGGSKNGSFYLSASNYNQGGLVATTGYNKTTFRFNGEQKYGRLTVSANTAYSIAKTDKTLIYQGLYSGGGNGTMEAVYSWPQTEDMSKYLNEDESKYRLFDGIWDLAADRENPYWIINKDKVNDRVKRFTGGLNASFKITDWWDVSARIGYDQYTTDAYTYIAPGSVVSAIYQGGRLNKSDNNYTYISSNLMTNFHKTFGDFDLNLLLGTTSEDTERHNQTHWGYDFITDGTLNHGNVPPANRFFTDATTKKRLIGVFSEFRASYKNIAYISVTGRNDWTSTLPIENRSYFYPSVSGSFVFTELLPKNDILSFGKLRLSWAQVGKDAYPYATTGSLTGYINYNGFMGAGNYYESGNPNLKPEIQTGWEIGTELRFLDGRLGLDYTYYHSETKNQIAIPRLSNASGYIMTAINYGSVVNKGMEIAITGKPVATKDFEWEITLNTSYNKGRLGEFLKGVAVFYPTDAQFGSVRAASIPNGGYFLGLTGYRWLRETDADGNEIANGRYQVDPATGLYKVSQDQNGVIGNREPSFIGGLSNTFRYKNLTFSFLLDFRRGGVVYNGTEHYLVSYGLSNLTTLNNRQSVTVSGVNSNTGDEYTQTYEADKSYVIGSVTYSGEAMIKRYWDNYNSNSFNHTTSVNWLKLRSVQISYDFTNLIKNQNIIKGLSVTVTGTNLLTITNYKGMDPEVSMALGTGGSGSTGIDYCSVPATSGLSFGINLTF
ncbi:MAG: SusC/RagA family TonB-linked outer membrane protein [Prevotellaceae bacterium]|jgi:TonB-linked SusC/RagA family outer membrane protein|nr:SusC/RagA family TonB-linked outer membrane protein [Prevotellaceae bacterium]